MLKIKNLVFSYQDQGEPVLRDIGFTVAQGEIWAIVGESGSGKSTLLKLIYGQHDLDSGHIYFHGKEILGPKANLIYGSDEIKYVAQESDLMPFTTVRDNVGKFLSNFYLIEKEDRITEFLAAVGLSDFAEVKVKKLSGGQKQRVALAQALAKKPELLLLDEPFGHIDNFRKEVLRRDLFRYLRTNNISCIVATHDKDDVLAFADRMLVLDNGKILSKGSPKTLYNYPREPVIAAFFDAYNHVPVSFLTDMDSDEKIIVYAHEINVVNKSNVPVEISEVFFKGHHYLNRAVLSGTDLFFYSRSKYRPGQRVFIAVTDGIIQKRMKVGHKEERKN